MKKHFIVGLSTLMISQISFAQLDQSTNIDILKNNEITSCEKKQFNETSDITETSLLHKAAANGDLIALNALIQAGVDLDAQNAAGNTALHIASKKGFLEAVTALLNAGADASIINNCGETALPLSKKVAKNNKPSYIRSALDAFQSANSAMFYANNTVRNINDTWQLAKSAWKLLMLLPTLAR